MMVEIYKWWLKYINEYNGDDGSSKNHNNATQVGEQCMPYTRIDFEVNQISFKRDLDDMCLLFWDLDMCLLFQSTENPLGFFQQHSENADFKWKLGGIQYNALSLFYFLSYLEWLLMSNSRP